MSRLRNLFYTFWYVSRWPHLARMLFIIGCGMFLIGGGIITLMRPFLPDDPARLNFHEVMGLIEKKSPRYVKFEAELDFSKRIYYTGWVPYWGNCPPNQTYQLPPPGSPVSEFSKLLGCTVSVEGANLHRVHRITRDVRENGKVVRKEQRDFAQVEGMKERIWVQSDTFREGDPQEKQWLSKTDFIGILATSEQSLKGLPEGFPRKISSASLPRPDTFVIHEVSDTYYDKKALEEFSSHYWVPVKGGGNSLFVWMTQGSEKDFDGSITGVLEPRDRSDYRSRNKGYAHFSVVTGEPLPARFGLIKYRSSTEYNDREVWGGWPFVLFGSLIAGAGLFGLLVYLIGPRLIFEAWKRTTESFCNKR